MEKPPPTPPTPPESPASAASPAPGDPARGACPRCHRPIPAGTADGLCPACLLEAGFFTRAPGDDAGADASVPPPPTPAELAPDFPQLEIIELLGRGGMGAVYKARQRHLDRLVALKLLRPGLDADPSFAERFTREARALAQLNHPGIVTLHEFGTSPGGRFFIVMEFVDGVNLRQLLAAGRLAPREALAIVPPLCDALQYAHDRGLVHRDIKPENILVDRLGRVKIADFGLAKLAAPGGPAGTATPTIGPWSSDREPSAKSGVMGTPRYMAPEQRERPTAVDHRADIYALGVVLYQMLTGELPDENQLQPPSRRVSIDVRLDEIVLRALEQEPARRYATAGELKTRVEDLSTSSSSSGERLETKRSGTEPTQPETVSPPAPTPLRLWLVPLLILATCIALAVTLSVLLPERHIATATVQDGRSTPSDPERIILSDPFLGQLVTPEAPIERLRRDLSVSRRRLSLITQISVTSTDPQKAADLANRAARLFCEQHSARVVDVALPPPRLRAPNRPVHVALGLLGGLLAIMVFHGLQLLRMLREPLRPSGLGLVVTGVLALPLVVTNLLVLVAAYELTEARIADALTTTEGRESFWGQLGGNARAEVPQLVTVAALMACLLADTVLIRRLMGSVARRWPEPNLARKKTRVMLFPGGLSCIGSASVLLWMAEARNIPGQAAEPASPPPQVAPAAWPRSKPSTAAPSHPVPPPEPPLGESAPPQEQHPHDDWPPVPLSAFTGKVTLLLTWTSGIPDSMSYRQHARNLLARHPEWAGRVEVVTLNLNASRDEALAVLKTSERDRTNDLFYGLDYWSSPLRRQFDGGIPWCYIVDTTGKVRHAGPAALLDVPALIAALLSPAST